MAYGRIKLPHMPEITIRNGNDFDQPTNMGYDEVIYDHNTRRYLTLSQQTEIEKLKKQLEEKIKNRNDSVQSIIGHFYKSR